MHIEIDDYISEEQKKQIAEKTFGAMCTAAFREQKQQERIFSNAAYAVVAEMIDKEMNGDLQTIIAKRVRKILNDNDSIKHSIFRKKDVWEKENSIAQDMLNKAIKENEKIIEEKVKESMGNIDQEYVLQVCNDMIGEVIERLVKGEK